MVEYIQSNDDSGNLALYAGLLAGGVVGGSALMAMATRPRGKKGKPGLGSLVYDNNPSYSAGSKQFALGGLGKMLSFGMLGGKTMDNGIKQMADSVVRDHLNQGGYKDSLKNLGKQIKEGNKSFPSDSKLVNELLGKGHTDDQIFEKLFEENPFTLFGEEDMANHRQKFNVNQAHAEAIPMNQAFDAHRELMSKPPRTASGFDANALQDKRPLVPTADTVAAIDSAYDTKAMREQLAPIGESRPHQQMTPGQKKLSAGERENLERRKQQLKELKGTLKEQFPDEEISVKDLAKSRREILRQHRESGMNQHPMSNISGNTRHAMMNGANAEAYQASRSYNSGRSSKPQRYSKPPKGKAGRKAAIMKMLGLGGN